MERDFYLRCIAIPPQLHLTYTGSFARDSLPLLTMACSLPVIFLYWSLKRYTNMVVFSVGWWLATMYHVCHLDPRGLQNSSLLGIPGPVWRTWDIVSAQWLLGRTWGETLGAQHPVTLGISNGIFPAVVGGARALGFFLAAFVCFPMPAIFAEQYWLWHSLWHTFCSFAFWDLYCCLDQRPAYPFLHAKRRRKPVKRVNGSSAKLCK
ncbi:hypothetical protein WJX73_010228 [Symbiochloris irregularis]|uniref:Uncharacterized protein n=1 Tax=Symbiochloris irregularis TaxID=706552 RepID=A0AAW1PQE0_9CHLO